MTAALRSPIETVRTEPVGRTEGRRRTVARRRARVPLLGLAVVGLAVLVFVLDTAPRATSAFGDSVESMNAGTWLVGARSLSELGWAESKGGAFSVELGTYAHHPPGVLAAAALAHAVGDAPLALRGPALLSSVASIVLLWLLLRELGCSTTASSVGLALAVGSTMFLLFGPMLNMEAVSLPWVLAAYLLWSRGPASRPVVLFVVAAMATLTSWQGVLSVGILCLIELVRLVRTRRLSAPSIALVAGATVGLVLTIGWLWWANGSGAQVFAAADKRSTVHGLSAGDLARRQLWWFAQTFPVWTPFVAAPGVVVGLARRTRLRPVLAVAVVVCLAFIVGFREGSYEHAYWNWWLLVPVALGGAAGVDALLSVLRSPARRDVTAAALLTAAVVSMPAAAAADRPLERTFWAGVDAGELLTQHPLPAGQSTAYLYAGDEWSTWAGWYTHRAPVVVWTAQDVDAIARREPDALILVRQRWPLEAADDWGRVVRVAVHTKGLYALIRADDFAPIARDVG